METKIKENLELRIVDISHSLIKQLSQNGCILIRDGNDIHQDIVATHHLAELMLTLDARMFTHYLSKIANWMLEPSNNVITNQFSIDTLSKIAPNHEIVRKVIDETILPTQLDSGAFTKFTAFLHGGDYFSTLWCVKILQNIDDDKYEGVVKKAYGYLLSNSKDARIQINQLGFLYLIINQGNFVISKTQINLLRNKIVDFMQNEELCSENMLTHLYLIEDLFSNEEDKEGISIAKKQIVKVLELENETKEIPSLLKTLEQEAHVSVYYHCLARAVISGAKVLDDSELINVSFLINRQIQSIGHQALYTAIEQGVELKQYLSKYGGIHDEFSSYNTVLEQVWEQQEPFNKSVFIMMPFRKGVEFRSLTNSIKVACNEREFKAIRVDDNDRKLADTVWDNLVANMLSCKYAIAVYVSENVVDRLDNSEPKMFANPNVALEFGFFKSRGQKILLLKDVNSPLPTDLEGFIWNEFDITDPDDDVLRAVKQFIEEIEKDETSSTAIEQ